MYKLSIHKEWWVNFTDSITTTDFDLGNFRSEVEDKLRAHGATLGKDFWKVTVESIDYISFENEEDMTAFLLRWS